MVFRLLILALILLPTTLFAAGKIYTWTDEDGNVFYGDRPPLEVEAEEIAIQGKKKAPVEVNEEFLPGQWYGSQTNGGEVKITLNASGTISYIQTRADQSVLNYQGIWSFENNSLVVITEFTQTAPPNGNFERKVEPLQLTYNILRFAGEEMELIIEGERFTVSKVN